MGEVGQPLTLEYAQKTKMLCDLKGLDYDGLWRFAKEMYQFLGNRPQMFPHQGIGGHPVIPNIDFILDDFFKPIKPRTKSTASIWQRP